MYMYLANYTEFRMGFYLTFSILLLLYLAACDFQFYIFF